MVFLVVGVVLLVLLLLAGRAFVTADPANLGRFLTWFLVTLGAAGGAVIIILLVMSDRFIPALAAAGGVAPIVMRGLAQWRRRKGAAKTGGSGNSEVETDLLRMSLDHDTGAMSGTVKHGPFAGRRLNELSQAELLALWRQCRIEDEASTRLIEAYLDRLRPDWREAASGTADGATADVGGGSMSREEAYAILGLAPGADAAAVKDAHRRLMMKLHPDQGGSTYLAAKINRAREILLGE
jgi:hypothetical protein